VSGVDEVIVRRALRDPERALDELDRAASERSLYEYAKIVWPIIEPATKLVTGRVMQIICEHLQAVSSGQIRRLAIAVPPGFSKSTLVAVIWPTWEWGPNNRPHLRTIGWSYAEALAIRDAVKCRRIVDSALYKRLWPHVALSKDQDEKSCFETTARGFRQALGITSATTGFRGDSLIVDDPHNVKDGESIVKREATVRWGTETLPSRVNSSETSTIVAIAQRVHSSDLMGTFLNDSRYERLVLPMEFDVEHPNVSKTSLHFVDWRQEDGELLWPERFPEIAVTELRETLGPYAYAGQYQQRPAPREGGMFSHKNFRVEEYIPQKIVKRVRGWDLAASTGMRSAFTAGVLLSLGVDGKTIYVENVVRKRETPAGVERLLKATADADPEDTKQNLPQDPAQAGKAQKATLAAVLAGHDVRFSTESGKKDKRAEPFSAQVEAGNVVLIRAAWNRSYIDECCLFPGGDYRDQVDATSRAYTALLMTRKRRLASAPTAYVGEGYHVPEQADEKGMSSRFGANVV
jgi:predicted phage terminase large subunit-like protein